MAKLPEKFEHDRLELLSPIVSEGTLKSRRNLVVGSFIVVAIYLLDKSLLDLNVFGLRLEGANPTKVLFFALFMITFWTILFCINGSKDAALNRERRHLRTKDENLQLKSVERNLENAANAKDGTPAFHTKKQLENERKKHLNQIERIKSAKKLTIAAFIIENALPFILAVMAIWFLVKNLICL